MCLRRTSSRHHRNSESANERPCALPTLVDCIVLKLSLWPSLALVAWLVVMLALTADPLLVAYRALPPIESVCN